MYSVFRTNTAMFLVFKSLHRAALNGRKPPTRSRRPWTPSVTSKTNLRGAETPSPCGPTSDEKAGIAPVKLVFPPSVKALM
jgi:hypothetical protein